MFRQIAASASEPSAYAPVESGQKPRWKISPSAFRAPTAQYVPMTAATPTASSVPQRSGPIPSLTIIGSRTKPEAPCQLLAEEDEVLGPVGAGEAERGGGEVGRRRARGRERLVAGAHDLDERGLGLGVVDVGRAGVAAPEHGSVAVGDERVRLRVAAVDAEEERAHDSPQAAWSRSGRYGRCAVASAS